MTVPPVSDVLNAAIEPGHVVSRLPPIRSEPLADRGAIATLRTPRAAARQDGTSWSLPAQGCDGPEIENALVKRERLADAALVAGQSRAQHRQPGVAQPIRGQVLGRPMILDQGDGRDFLQCTLSGELRRLPLRHCT